MDLYNEDEMMHFLNVLQDAIQLDAFDVMQVVYMSLRGIVVYFIGVSLARFNKKIIGIRTPFNFILFVILGSIFVAAIVDGKLFLPVIVTMLILLSLNTIMKALAFYCRWVELFVKGSSIYLVKDGKIDWYQMNAHFITKRELLNELASQAHTYSIDQVDEAVLASDGSINFVFKK